MRFRNCEFCQKWYKCDFLDKLPQCASSTFLLWFPSEMASINPFSYSSTFSDLHLSYSRWIVRKKELELDGMVHRAYNAFFMGSSKSKNKKSLRISIKISFAKVLIEKLWRILELRNQSCIIKYLIFKLIRQVGFFERSDKMTWFWNSRAKKTSFTS